MTPKPSILLIEDDNNIVEIIKLQAEISGYKLIIENDGMKGLRALEKQRPLILILDLMLPSLNGLDILRKLKSSNDLKSTPVVIISKKNAELDIVLGLELGADDYVTKPFSPKILFSRIKAILRRCSSKESEPLLQEFAFGDFYLELDQFILTKKGSTIPLTLSEFGILRRLLLNQGRVLTRAQLLDDIHSEDGFIVDRNIDVHIASLRKKMGPDFSWIETVRGIGYRFKEPLSI